MVDVTPEKREFELPNISCISPWLGDGVWSDPCDSEGIDLICHQSGYFLREALIKPIVVLLIPCSCMLTILTLFFIGH